LKGVQKKGKLTCGFLKKEVWSDILVLYDIEVVVVVFSTKIKL
jgi:hypothetical protein